MPFLNAYERASHFKKHGQDFGLADENAYERMADEFMFGLMNSDTRECIRPNGNDRLRCETVVRHFGVASITPEFLRTFYPIKASTIHKRGGIGGFFAYECGRIDS